MTAKTASGVVPRELTWPRAPSPSTLTEVYWVYAVRKGRKRAPSSRSGKWLIFEERTKADALWETIALATTAGKLGPSAKCGTARSNRNARDPSKTVICVYTPDFDDRADVMRVREALRSLGVTWKIPYKLDATTLEGRYAVRGDAKVSAIWA